MLIKLVSALGMGSFMLVSLFMAARIRYRKPKPAEKRELPTTVIPPAEALHHSDWKIRLHAIESLDIETDEALLPDVTLMLNDTDPDVREAAARVVTQFGSSAVDGLCHVLSHGNLDARALAAKLLADAGDRRAVPALIDALRDYSIHVRLPAVEALGSIRDHRAIETLALTLANDHEADVRTAAARALQHIGTPEALAALKTRPSA